MTNSNSASWKIYQGDGTTRQNVKLPEAPPWRQFRDDAKGVIDQQNLKGATFNPPDEAIEMVNAAISLRRPLLITGNPGTGKSSLAYAVARELGLGNVLKWSITTRSTLKDGLYSYDAIARLQEAQASQRDNRQETGNYITLAALGAAFLPSDLPRVLLIDEID
ncbi:MAG: AAA family ATPase, partial [Pseudanabaena sp.]